MKDYFTAIDEFCTEPYVDKDHLGCVGASFGGFSVYWIAGHHDGRFKAFIAHDGIFNLEMQYLETEEKWFANWDMGGAYWEKDNAIAQRTFANSPHKFVDKWDTPILCIHGELDGAPDSPYNPISREQLLRSGMDYAALGHVHTTGGPIRIGDCFCAWPGCAEGRGFDETGEKGVLLAEVQPGEARAEFLPLGGRRYEVLRVAAGDDAVQAVLDALPQGAQRHIFRIVLTGERERAPDLAAIRAALEGRVFAAQLRDETRLKQDIWAKAGQGTLRGLFLSELRAQYEAAETPAERERVTMAARWGLAALDHDEEVFAL